MRLLLVFAIVFLVSGQAHCASTSLKTEAALKSETRGNSTDTETVTRVLKKDSEKDSDEVVGPPSSDVQRRVSKDLLKSLRSNSTSRSTSDTDAKRRTGDGKVQILEAGSTVKTKGEARILKRGPPAVGTRFSDAAFKLRNSLRPKPLRTGIIIPPTGINSGIRTTILTASDDDGFGTSGGTVESFEDDGLGKIPIISIPASNIPPPVYSFDLGGSPSPAPVYAYPGPAPSVLTYKPSGGGGSSGGGSSLFSTTAMPEPGIVFPPEEVTPGPQPIGPSIPGTSVPVIGGGGSSGSGRPPSPPPDEIFPPAPPADYDDDLIDEEPLEGVGRKLKVKSDTTTANTRFTTGSLRSRSRFAPSLKSSSRVTSKELFKTSSKESLRGGVLRRERLRDKVKEFKTLVAGEPDPIDELIDNPDVITDFVFSDIKCFKTREKEYFGATIHMKSDFHVPYIRDRPQDPLSSQECRLEPVPGTRGSYHMDVTDLRGCGVEQCGEAMCLTMVFPRVPTLALADDEVTTIKCTPQKSTMSDTKTISFAGDSMENRRSSSTVEGGVQEFVAEVGVFRQNPGASNGLFVKRVNSGGVVQLGEPLQLRSVVRGTDGWKHSKLTDVKVWRMGDVPTHRLDNLDPKQASEVITLVDGQGCRNEEYEVIAEEHPLKDPRNDMVHHFTFKAFLFRGQRVNEPLIVTARIHACQENNDCVMACESGRRARVKRSPVELHNATALIHDFDSQLALRVVGLKDHPSSILDDEFAFDYNYAMRKGTNRTLTDPVIMSCNEKMVATGLGGGCIMLLMCGLALALYTYVKQGRVHGKTATGGSYPYPPPNRQIARMPPTTTPNTRYHKPLPPPPAAAAEPSRPQNQPVASNPPPDSGSAQLNADISQVAKLLQQLTNTDGQKTGGSGGKTQTVKSEGKQHSETISEYACIDEQNSSAGSSSEDLSKTNKKDGLYIVYCYNKDKKGKQIMLPMSAPSSMRMRRKQLKLTEDEDDDDEDVDFIDDDESEANASQTEEATEESDDSYGAENDNKNGNLGKNQGVRRTVRSVKKKSKQNNNLPSTRAVIRRRLSSVYREGYLNGCRGASSRGGSFPMRYKKSPSTSNIPAASNGGGGYNNSNQHNASTRRIRFSVRDRKSTRKHHQKQQQHSNGELYSSEGTTMTSDLDSAYSGSNCSKLTEDFLYELKHGRGEHSSSGRYPDFHNFHKLQNMMDVQRQLRNGPQGQKQQKFLNKPDARRTCSANTTVAIGLESPPLPLGETKATHFVTRDDSSTKILIVPETHV